MLELELEPLANKLAVLIERDTYIPRELFYKYKLAPSDKKYEARAIEYFTKLIDDFTDRDMTGRISDYFEISSKVISYCSIRLQIPAYILMESND